MISIFFWSSPNNLAKKILVGNKKITTKKIFNKKDICSSTNILVITAPINNPRLGFGNLFKHQRRIREKLNSPKIQPNKNYIAERRKNSHLVLIFIKYVHQRAMLKYELIHISISS